MADSGILETALKAIASIPSAATQAQYPRLVKPDGSPLIRPETSQFRKKAAERKGSMKKWIPYKNSELMANQEREFIVERSSDLVGNDPNAAGIVEKFASTVVGTGLNPHPTLIAESVGMTEDEAKTWQEQERLIMKWWGPFADVGRRMSFHGLQFLAQRMVVQYGEYLFLAPMINKPDRPYMLAIQAVNPLRLKTPVDLENEPNIKDGVEIGSRGEARAYWIKRSENSIRRISDTSDNFVRVSAKRGHRLKVIHGFPVADAEAVRGVPFFAPGMKFFKDLSDYLDAELVANVVTAAFSVFIETGSADPLTQAQKMATITETGYKSDGTEYDQRYEEIIPGGVMYGNIGEKPHTIETDRPGRTFDVFIRTILRSIANSHGIPYPVLFQDFEGMNFASYRSAMLEAWRVFKNRRKWLGETFCQPLFRMLIEEAWLMGELSYPVDKFYQNMHKLTSADWVGPPKGQIEPLKEIQADELAHNNNFKTLEEILLESGRELSPTLRQLADEKGMIEDLGLEPEPENEVAENGID